MTITEIAIGGAWIIQGRRFPDDRGWFQEWFRQSRLEETTGTEFRPVQANISRSALGVVRGIHYSTAPAGQTKLVTVMHGEIDDYVVDLDHRSSNFGRWERIRLSSDVGNAVLISAHKGHAFQALRDGTVVSYLVSAEFDPISEKGITPLCPHVAIEWQPGLDPIISDKDRTAPDLHRQKSEGGLPFS